MKIYLHIKENPSDKEVKNIYQITNKIKLLRVILEQQRKKDVDLKSLIISRRRKHSKKLILAVLNKENLDMSDQIEHTEEVKSVAVSNDQFSKKLFNVLKEEDGNLIMSPFSVSAVIAMVSTGAGGETLQQIKSGFLFPSSSSLKLGYQDTIPALRRSTDDFTLEVANTVFAMKDFSVLPEYQEMLNRSFHASIQMVDFGDAQGAARMINTWVEKITRDRIKDLINEDMLSSLTRMVLVNAIYFKGEWKAKFDPKLTKEEDFFVSPSITVKVPMMKQKREILWTSMETLSSSMVELPYKGDRIVMQVLLPGEKQGLRELEEKLMNHNVQELFEKASYKTKVEIQLPKFKLEQTIPLNDHLTTLGMKNMFTSDLADFSGIDGTRELFVSKVIQKAFIDVNEGGSEAAVATAVICEMKCARPKPYPSPEQFIADHPFIFYLRDKTTGMLLFQGRVVNPEQ